MNQQRRQLPDGPAGQCQTESALGVDAFSGFTPKSVGQPSIESPHGIRLFRVPRNALKVRGERHGSPTIRIDVQATPKEEDQLARLALADGAPQVIRQQSAGNAEDPGNVRVASSGHGA